MDYTRYDRIEQEARERLKDEPHRLAKDAFRDDLEHEYLNVRNGRGLFPDVSQSKREKLFNIAWEEGHSSGYSDVAHYYAAFAALVLPD